MRTDQIAGPNATDFTLSDDTCAGQGVAPGSSCTVLVTFAPAETGPYNTPLTATLTFNDNASPPSQQVALSGKFET